MVFAMNSTSLIAIYHCYKAANIYFFKNKTQKLNFTKWLVLTWISALLIITLMQNNFVLIKIHAGIVLVYSLIVHLLKYKDAGSPIIAGGIIVSFLPIAIHSLRLSLGEWFNYKDIAHLMIMASLIMIGMGVKKKLKLRT
jgi:hypothetical protein